MKHTPIHLSKADLTWIAKEVGRFILTRCSSCGGRGFIVPIAHNGPAHRHYWNVTGDPTERSAKRKVVSRKKIKDVAGNDWTLTTYVRDARKARKPKGARS